MPIRFKYHILPFLLFALLVFSGAMIGSNRYTPLYINHYALHFALLWMLISSVALLTGIYFFNLQRPRYFMLVILLAFGACFTKGFLTWGGDWKTQTIIYRQRHNPAVTVEFQMRADRFNFGYKEQIVERLTIMPAIDWITAVDTAALNPTQWNRIDEKINELGIPGDYVDLPGQKYGDQ